MYLRELVWEGVVKVKLSLSFSILTDHYAMKAYWGVDV
jgi:hypothetical protein